MANKYFHLRAVFEQEKTGNLDRRGTEHPLVAGEYRLGASRCLAPALLEEDGVVASLLGAIGLHYAPDLESTQASEIAWRLASNPNRTRMDVVPQVEGTIIDTNENPILLADFALNVALALRQGQDYFRELDGGAGNSVFLADFINADCHRIV